MQNRFGVMIDMSRNSVMSVEGLKRFLPLLAKMGYNCCMLYTEDTYEVDDEPYFGYMRGRYTKEELKEINAFAADLGIEMIPCIQTLAHLGAALRWGKIPCDCGDILLTDDERTYQVIEHMFRSLSECFTSPVIHIGMDEAHMLGRGKHLDLHGYETVNAIMKRHLAKVVDLAKKYGFEPIMWSDMFFRPWNNGGYFSQKTEIPKEVIESIPEGLTPVYWDYYRTEEAQYDAMISNHRQLCDKVWFAGGAWCWTGFIPDNRRTLDTMIPALEACKKNAVENIFFTMWGDDGGECSHFSQLPVLYYLAEYRRGNKDPESIKKNFAAIFGVDFDDFMKIDLPNRISDEKAVVNPSKYMLYSDLFNDYLDYTVDVAKSQKYVENTKILAEVKKNMGEYAYVFETAEKLSHALEIKYALGKRIRAAYEAGNKAELPALAEDCREAAERIRDFHAAFMKQWFFDNKPTGFDVQDRRLGGIILRLESVAKRLEDYAAGKIDRIVELDETLLPFGRAPEGNEIALNGSWNYMSSNNM